jgi:hypothetical protein
VIDSAIKNKENIECSPLLTNVNKEKLPPFDHSVLNVYHNIIYRQHP